MAAPPGLDETEFADFHACTSGPLWAYLRRLTNDPSLADDALQESYLRFLSRPPLPASSVRERRAYLFRIATNLVHDRWRRERRERLGLERLAPPGATDPRGASRLDFAAAFARLRPRQRAVLWLACVEGCGHREIAGILGLHVASVRVLLFRARRKMRQDLAKKG